MRVLRDISVLAGELNYFHSEDISSERSRTQFLRPTQSHPLKTTIKPLPNVLTFLMRWKFVSYMIITSTLRPIQPHDLSFPLKKSVGKTVATFWETPNLSQEHVVESSDWVLLCF